MIHARPLPNYLAQRYHGWKATSYAENKAWYRQLALGGQHPRAMVISCCDSRVHVTSIFGADAGDGAGVEERKTVGTDWKPSVLGGGEPPSH